MKKRVKLLRHAWLFAGLLVLPARGPDRAVAAPTPAGPAAGSDTVLATVGPRVVGRSRFLTSWAAARPPARADSLTPEAAFQFLDVLVDRELMALAAGRQTWTWTAAESAGYQAAVDQLVLRAALDSVMALTRAALPETAAAVKDPTLLGITARERITSTLEIRFVEPAVERLARAFHAIPPPSSDSSLAVQVRMLQAVPELPDEARREVVARFQLGECTAGDLVDDWARLNPAYRPRIDAAEQVHDLVRNRAFQVWLREEGRRRNLAQRPDVKAMLAQQREHIAIAHWLEREVVDRVPMDTVAARRRFDRERDRYQLPERYEIIHLVLSSRSDAHRMAADFRDAARAESLAARAERSGVRYRRTLTAAQDSVLFAKVRVAGPGTVVGPDSVRDGWAVTRVVAGHPARRLEYAEVRERAQADWKREATEQRLREALDAERRRSKVTVRRETVSRMVRDHAS
jgi:hypothetical protein